MQHGLRNGALDPAAGPPGSHTIVCTIISKNYLAAARALMRSIQAVHPGLRCVTLLVDRNAGAIDPAREPFLLLEADQLAIPLWEHFAMKYDILELNTAVKPFLLELLFERFGADKLIYFDPDILVYQPLDELLALLDQHQIILTPHILDPLDDDRSPGELDFLRAGSYNLGFLALARSASTQALLAWWKKKLYHECLRAPERGIFVDQHWMDLAPGLFDGVHVLRDPGYNLAYWNFKTRDLQASATGYQVNGRPLVFFHFSGFRVDDLAGVSIHQNRFVLADLNQHYRDCFEAYRRQLNQHGFQQTRSWPYAYGAFADGVRITPVLRACLREHDPDGERWPNPYDITRPDNFRAWAFAPAVGLLSPYALSVHGLRTDLQRAFPDPRGADQVAYAKWFAAQRGSSELFPDDCVLPVLEVLERLRVADPVAPRPLRRASRLARTLAYHRAYPTAIAPTLPANPLQWSADIYTGPGGLYGAARRALLRSGLLARVKRLIGHRQIMTARFFFSYGRRPAAYADAPEPLRIEPAGTCESAPPAPGVNVIGYLRSATGVGQAARNVVSALRTTTYPLAVQPLEVQDRARKQEFQDHALPQGTPHAINLFHVNADMTLPVQDLLGRTVYSNRYNVGFWFWELAAFPPQWMPCFDVYDEIWVASRFIQQSLAGLTCKPVTYMPLPVLVAPPASSSRAELGLPEQAFLFLFIFDALSIIERKNPWALIEAFKRAFPPAERRQVHLVIKANNLQHSPAEHQRLRRELAEIGGILIDRYLSRPQIDALLAQCDAYVSLHRSEGYGLTLAEAMALGKPVIATAYSGNMDFMDPAHSYLVPYQLSELRRDYPPYQAGACWADPDIAVAAELFREVALDPDQARARGALAARFIQSHFQPPQIGARLQQRLDEIMRLQGASRTAVGA